MATPELLAQIQNQIDALSDTTSLDDLVLLSVAIDNATADRIITVPTVSALPDLTLGNIQYGTVFFVEQYNIPVIAGTKSWLGLDGRLVRSDAPNSAIWSWGSNSYGTIGDGTTVNKSSPVSVVGGFTDWHKITVSGSSFVSALEWGGSLWSWGNNSCGRLGDGTTVNKSSPVSVIGGFTDWCNISNGVGIRTNGTAWSWGCNCNGQLGDGTTVNKSSPVSVVGGFADWEDVSSKSTHMIALKINHTLWSWGCNGVGQLGDGTTVNKSSPVSVIGGFTDWCKINAAANMSAGIRSNGTLWSWGNNISGVLGDGTIIGKNSPVSVVGGFTDWYQVSIGSNHTTGIRTNGSLWTWGCNDRGQLGDGTTVNKSSPVSVIGGFTDWSDIAGGNMSNIAIRSNGTAWAWGYNSTGRIGDGTTINRSSPVSIVGGFTDWCKASAGSSNNIALRKF